MEITKENIFALEKISENDRNILLELLDDINDINKYITNELYIDIQHTHDDYSAERTEPCLDYYGFYSLRFKNKPTERVGWFMNIGELDNAVYIISDFCSLCDSK